VQPGSAHDCFPAEKTARRVAQQCELFQALLLHSITACLDIPTSGRVHHYIYSKNDLMKLSRFCAKLILSLIRQVAARAQILCDIFHGVRICEFASEPVVYSDEVSDAFDRKRNRIDNLTAIGQGWVKSCYGCKNRERALIPM
jgi:hypothetical protein